MTDIRMVICGKMTIYYPKDEIGTLWGAYYVLHCFQSGGAVLVHRTGAGESVTTIQDGPALTQALAEIEALLTEYPDCAIKNRPFLNEIFMQDGTYRYASLPELTVILQKLYQAHHSQMPHCAGAVVSDSPLQEQQIQ